MKPCYGDLFRAKDGDGYVAEVWTTKDGACVELYDTQVHQNIFGARLDARDWAEIHGYRIIRFYDNGAEKRETESADA